MNKKVIVLGFCTIFVIWIMISLFLYNKKDASKKIIPKNISQKKDITKNPITKLYDKDDCKIKEEKFSVKGFSMEPLIKNGSEVITKLNYYNCNKSKPKSWDIVIFENPFTLDRIIKKLSILSWDKLEVDKKKKTIKVNWKIIVNSQKQEYIFKDNELKWFEIYTQNWIIIENTYFIFWDNIHWSIDSRVFWSVTLEGLVWKVELDE